MTTLTYQPGLTVPDARRSAVIPALFMVPLVLSGTSFVAGGEPLITDIAMLAFAAICIIGLLAELKAFSQRFGVGALVLYGGILVWVLHDYFDNWAFLGSNATRSQHIAAADYDSGVIAKAAFYNILFFSNASVALFIPWHRRLLKPFAIVPEPNGKIGYVLIPTALCAFGLLPYFVFTKDPFYLAIYYEIVGGRGGGTRWTVGRTGNINYSWGGYVAQIIDMGMAAGVLAGSIALLVRSLSLQSKIFLMSQWALWSMLGFGTGSRGRFIAVVLPIILVGFYSYSAEVGARLRRVSFKGYFVAGLVMFFLVIGVAIASTFRNKGFQDISITQVAESEIKGNEMFTAGLPAYNLIPDEFEPFYSDSILETCLRPVPDTIIRFILHPIPRALWKDKPIDPVWLWYNEIIFGNDAMVTGSTASRSITAAWYARYGIIGVIQGALIFGFLLGGVERAIRLYADRPFTLITSFSVLVFLFRAFRDFEPNILIPVVMACVLLAAMVRFWNMFTQPQSA